MQLPVKQWTAMALVAITLRTVAANPIAACDGLHQFVAHEASLCIFYQCANRVPYEFACPKGTRVPSYYLSGDSSPCTIKVKGAITCARCNVSDDRIPGANVSRQCANFQPCATRPGCTCIDQVAGYYCSCPAVPQVLPTPQSNPVPACDVNVCLNNGTCTQLYKNKFCNCPPPWTGKRCETNACDNMVCPNGKCVWDGKGVYCQCELCFTGPCCDVVRPDPVCRGCNQCIRGSNCSEVRVDLCDCNPCPVKSDSCSNGVFNKTPRKCSPLPVTASDTFTLMFEDNDSGQPQALEVYVSAALDDGENRSVEVYAPLGTPDCNYYDSAVIQPGTVHKFDVNICLKHTLTAKKPFGIRVHEINKRLVNVYCINRAQYSADGWLALPDTIAGTLFTIISYSPIVTASQIAVVAIENGTVVTIILSNPSDYLAGSAANSLIVVYLDAYETYQIQSTIGDLTGTVISSDKPVHVYSGESRGWVGPSTGNPDYSSTTVSGYSKSRDNLIFECLEVRQWGSTYAIVPLPRTMINYTYTEEAVRVAGTTATTCQLYATDTPSAASNGSAARLAVPPTTIVLGAAPFTTQFYLNASRNYFLSCSQPVEVVEITESSLVKYRIPKNDNSADPYWYYDDPSFIFVPAVSSYSNYFHFVPPVFSVTNGSYLFTYIRLIARDTDYTDILINDVSLYPTPPPGNEALKPWSAIYVPNGTPVANYPSLYASIFRLSSNESSAIYHPDRAVKFMCIVEGFDDRESYAFPLGANLTNLRTGSSESLSDVLGAPPRLPLLVVD